MKSDAGMARCRVGWRRLVQGWHRTRTSARSGNRPAFILHSPSNTMSLENSENEINFGLCSVQTLQNTPVIQYSLDPSRDTIILFTTLVDNTQCDVRFTWHPFRRTCGITYHEYELYCSPDVSSKSSIIEVAQLIYERHFFKNAGYRFALSDTE
jgi:hypothetical protein